ncbi:unnamed protein product [Amaranthus hypochondriacus]
MMLSRISRSISRSSRASLLNAVTGCDGYSARIASQSGMFASRANPELGFFHSYFSSIGAAKHAAPSFSSFSSSNFVNPSISRFFSTDTSNKQSYEMKEGKGEIKEDKSVPISNRIAGLYHTAVSPLFHIEEGLNEIIADYVHHEMTRAFILVCVRLYLLIVMKDLILALFF